MEKEYVTNLLVFSDDPDEMMDIFNGLKKVVEHSKYPVQIQMFEQEAVEFNNFKL